MHGIAEIFRNFIPRVTKPEIQAMEGGKIHQTYLITLPEQDQSYILQKINTRVFKDPAALMYNYSLLYEHLKKKGRQDLIPGIVPSTKGGMFLEDKGDLWRLFEYIPGTIAHERVDRPGLAEKAACTFGRLIRYLSGLDPKEFKLTIPGFHDLGLRYRELEKAADRDRTHRLHEASGMLDRIEENKDILLKYNKLVTSHLLPLRLVHHDAKISNILFDRKTGKAMKVLDLDTVMPGTLLSDFGDMVRGFACSVPEDEMAGDEVFLETGIFSEIVKGYTGALGDIMASSEMENLLFGAKMMIYMQAIRYLTDFLEGDVYYKTDYPDQNLHRCKNQMNLLGSLLNQECELKSLFLSENI